LFGTEISITAGEKSLIYLNRTKLFNQLYVNKQGNKEIKGFVEKKFIRGTSTGSSRPKQILSVSYEGFDQDICDAVGTYDEFVANKEPLTQYRGEIVCEETDGKEVVIAIDDAIGPQAFANLYTELTRRTRVE